MVQSDHLDIDGERMIAGPGRPLIAIESTVARAISGLLPPNSGRLLFEGSLLEPLVRNRTSEQRRRIQYIFQNPDASLNPRARIRIADIMHMSSGLRIKAPQDPDYDLADPYPDHLYLYTGGINSFHYAATRPPQWPPNSVGRYRNTDPVLVNYLIRLAVEKRGEDYLSFPQRALFDKLGIRTMVIETDPFGNFLGQGYGLGSGRDWARLGNLFLQDGVWNGERILPEGFVKFVSTLAPAWEADRRPIYGGFFWLNGAGQLPVPRDAYYMAGAGGQTTLIIPSHDLVVARLGHYRGASAGAYSFQRALALLMEAVPQRRNRQANDVQSRIQFPAEYPFPHLRLEVVVGRGDEPDVNARVRAAVADALNLTRLEKPQQQRLDAPAHLADFLQEQRSVRRHFQQTGLVAVGADEAAPEMSEQLGFEQHVRQAGALERHNRGRRARAPFVNQPRNCPLAGASLTGQENMCIRAGRGVRLSLDQPDGVALPDQTNVFLR
jgi:ABC-type oligopeptide transport system ATPase subunit